MHASRGCALLLVLAVLLPSTASGAARGAAKPDKKPDAAVRARVSAFYKAWVGQDWAAMLGMMTPDMQRCGNPDDLATEMGGHGAEQVVAWKIKKIAPAPKPPVTRLEIECTGESATIDAAMKVTLSTTVKAPGGKPKTVDGVEQMWLLVDGTWCLAVGRE